MGEAKKPTGGNKKIGGGALVVIGGILYNVMEPYINDFIQGIIKQLDNQIKNNNDGKIKIPNLCQPDFPLKVDVVVSLLEDKKFTTLTAPLQLSDANSKYKDCIDTQVVEIAPKQGKRVDIGEVIKIKYITQEVIEASIKIFQDEEKEKIEYREKKALEKLEHKERRKEKMSVIMDKAKETVGGILNKEKKGDKEINS